MAAKQLPDVNSLRQLFKYDAETGNLIWRTRDAGMFKREQDCLRWNTCFAGKVAGGPRAAGHIYVAIANRSYLAHRVIWAIMHGTWPVLEIDHINGNPSDNRIKNLREVSHKENLRNQRLSGQNATGVPGVYAEAGKYRVKIDTRHIGYFDTIAEASKARVRAIEKFGYSSRHGALRGTG